jgi:probable HAF family extracellular repeat protein
MVKKTIVSSTFISTSVLIIMMLLTSTASAEPLFNITDLGTLSGGDKSFATAISNDGQIVGDAYTASGDRRATLFDPTGNGNNIDLGTSPLCNHSRATSINDNGQIIGGSEISIGTAHRAILFDPTGQGNNIVLGILWSDWSLARSINNNGKIVGFEANASGHSHATLFDPTGAGNNIDLGTLSGSTSQAWAINNNGQIAGYAEIASGGPLSIGHATLFDPTGGGNNIDLGTLGGDGSNVWGMNDNGQIVGYAQTVSGHYHATLFDPTGKGNNIDLGTLGGDRSYAVSVNNSGTIVGHAKTSSGEWHATMFSSTGDGNNIDLNMLIDPALGWTLTRAYINDKGLIAGCGRNPDGFTRAYLLTPIPQKIALDIKPANCPNPLNVKSKGFLPVAILGSADFDVYDIDVASIQLAGIDPNRSYYEDVATPVSDSNDCNCIPDGPDGFLDLTLKFKTQRILEAIGEVNHGDVMELELTGELFDETPIEGADCILIKGKHKPLNKADINKDGVVDSVDFVIFSQNWMQSSIVDE